MGFQQTHPEFIFIPTGKAAQIPARIPLGANNWNSGKRDRSFQQDPNPELLEFPIPEGKSLSIFPKIPKELRCWAVRGRGVPPAVPACPRSRDFSFPNPAAVAPGIPKYSVFGWGNYHLEKIGDQVGNPKNVPFIPVDQFPAGKVGQTLEGDLKSWRNPRNSWMRRSGWG